MSIKKLNWQPNKAEYWQYLPSPARPWPSEVKWFEKYVLEKKKQNKKAVLILGSTVEFRSMLHKHKMDVHVADISADFYNILTKTQSKKLKHTGKETVHIVNWVSMELEQKFDLIFGDWVPGVLHTKDYTKFYKNIIKHLKDDGLFITRDCLQPTSKPVDIEKVVKDHYANYAKKYSFYETSMQCVYGYRPDPKTRMGRKKYSQEALDSVYKKGIMTKKDYDFFTKALEVENDGLSIIIKKDFENKIKKYFNILHEHHVKEPSSEWYPIYVLEPK